MQFDRAGSVALCLVESGKNDKRIRDVGMIQPCGFFFNVERSQQKRLGVYIIAFVPIENAEAFEGKRNAGVVFPQQLLPNFERSSIVHLTPGIVSALFVNDAQIVNAVSGAFAFRSVILLEDCQCSLKVGCGARVIFLLPLKQPDVAKGHSR